MTSTTTDMLQAALWYARQGIPIFPCHWMTDRGCACGKDCGTSAGKHPLTLHGFKDATTDEAQITAWWRESPHANIAMPTGAASKTLVLDRDPRNGGDESFEALVHEHGAPDGAAEQSTGGGGRHYIFRDAGRPVPKSIAPGLDIRGDGGYIVLAPSATKAPYQFDGLEGAKALLNPAPPPAWLLKLIAEANSNSNGNGRAHAFGGTIPDGDKHHAIISLAGTLCHRGIQMEAAYAACRALKFESPVSDEDIRERVEDVYRRYQTERAEPNGASSSAGQQEHHAETGDEWPDPLRDEAFHGLAGELVRMIEPHSEADPAALLIQFLTAFGNVIGRQAHFVAEADRHYTNLFTVIVGLTSKGRKGSSLGQIQRPLAAIDPAWSDSRVMGGLSSGEGLIHAVRDPVHERVQVKEKGHVRHEQQMTDEGEPDKRLLVTESEFASVLQRCERETNTLSALIRQAWDTGNLRTLTRKPGPRSSDAHVSLIGHITKDELKRLLTDTAAANGFCNRILWVCAKRSKVLPEGGELHTVDFGPIIRQLQDAVSFSRTVARMQRDEQARAIWREVYPDLSEGKPGLLGDVTARAEAYVMRLACLYALLDKSEEIRAGHLLAALAVWNYCYQSARFVFGDALGDPTADEILRNLRNRSGGMTRDEIREHFQRNKTSAEISRALGVLQEHGLARMTTERERADQKRPVERWFAV